MYTGYPRRKRIIKSTGNIFDGVFLFKFTRHGHWSMLLLTDSLSEVFGRIKLHNKGSRNIIFHLRNLILR